MDEEKYNGWINSNNIIKRSLAIAGHNALGSIIIYICFLLVILVLVLIFGFIGALIN